MSPPPATSNIGRNLIACFAVLFCLLFIRTNGRAQQFSRLTVDEGLSQGFVNSIIQTRDGFMWFATLDGLNRYDGNSFKVFRNDPSDPHSINSDFVLELFEDTHGVLWVITDRGPNLYDPSTGQFYQPVMTEGALPSGIYPFRQFRQDRHGHIWAIFNDKLVLFTPGNGASPEQIAGELHIRTDILPAGRYGYISSISIIGDELWIVTQQGDIALSLSSFTIRSLTFDHLPAPVRFWEDTIDHSVWVIHPQGVSRLSGGPIKTAFITNGAMANIDGIHSASGLYFFSSSKVYKWQNDVLYPLPEVVDKKIISAFADRKGLLWLGTNAYGVYKILTGRTQFVRFLEGSSQVRAPVEDKQGRIWVSNIFENRMIYCRLDLASGELGERLYKTPHNKAIASAKGGFWIICSNNDVCYLDQAGSAANCYAFPKGKTLGMSMCEDHLGRLVNTTTDGLFVIFDPASRQWSYWSFAHLFNKESMPTISHLLEDPQGGIFWIGTTDGLVEAQPAPDGSNCRFNIYNSKNGLSRQRILSLAIDPYHPNRLWIGTQHGLNWLDKSSGVIESLAMRDGLPNDVIYSILPASDSILWAGTNAGLLRINHRSRRWQHFTTYDGLPGSEFNTGVAIRLSSGKMIMGGVNGFVLFDPDDVQISHTRPIIAEYSGKVKFENVEKNVTVAEQMD
ncbi:MAG TPA: two-component regulator propeller domain-containing protein, partial [Saprospiraceae bacterium]|nr:two-component regulator propeller domain-containing protein [Saprospiraceae bacterium]